MSLNIIVSIILANNRYFTMQFSESKEYFYHNYSNILTYLKQHQQRLTANKPVGNQNNLTLQKQKQCSKFSESSTARRKRILWHSWCIKMHSNRKLEECSKINKKCVVALTRLNRLGNHFPVPTASSGNPSHFANVCTVMQRVVPRYVSNFNGEPSDAR